MLKNLGENNLNKVFVVFNGPSSIAYRGKLKNCYATNFAYRDFDVRAIFAVDALSVKQIEQDDPNCEKHTKKRPWTPEGWHTRIIPGIDSGSYALETAIIENPNSVIYVVGADGVLKQNNQTVYQYSWRNGRQPMAFSHLRHRDSCLQIIKKYHNQVYFVAKNTDLDLQTITHEEFEKLL